MWDDDDSDYDVVNNENDDERCDDNFSKRH